MAIPLATIVDVVEACMLGEAKAGTRATVVRVVRVSGSGGGSGAAGGGASHETTSFQRIFFRVLWGRGFGAAEAGGRGGQGAQQIEKEVTIVDWLALLREEKGKW